MRVHQLGATGVIAEVADGGKRFAIYLATQWVSKSTVEVIVVAVLKASTVDVRQPVPILIGTQLSA